MTRIEHSDCDRHCFRCDHRQANVINAARTRAHEKHGENSIESIPVDDPRWLAVLVEEVGEVAHALTYDANPARVPEELVDVLAVASAWLDAYREAGRVSYGWSELNVHQPTGLEPEHVMQEPSVTDLRWTCSACDWTASDAFRTAEERGAHFTAAHKPTDQGAER